MEHLFKLKKDGKTVGYVKLWHWGGLLYSRDTKFNTNTNKPQLPGRIEGENLTFHSFVTKDKHGKDVFAGDLFNYDCCGNFHNKGTGYFVWDEDILGWRLQNANRKKIKYYFGMDFRNEDIELIEDKEDD